MLTRPQGEKMESVLKTEEENVHKILKDEEEKRKRLKSKLSEDKKVRTVSSTRRLTC